MTPREGVWAWAVVDRHGRMWKANEVKGSMEHERDALNAYVDAGHYKACGPYSMIPLYAHPAATAREEAIRAEVIEECAKVCEDVARRFNDDGYADRQAGRSDSNSCQRWAGAVGCRDAIRALALARSVKDKEV